MIRRLKHLHDWYGYRGLVRLAGDVLITKIAFPGARIVRRPFYIRGRPWIRIGKGFTTGPGLRLDALPNANSTKPLLVIGRDVQVNDYVHIAAGVSVTIGDRSLIASRVFITDHNHGTYGGDQKHSSPLIPPDERPETYAPVCLEEDVWVGEGVVILPGVTIGKGAVIGALSVVSHDVPKYTIAVGAPARPIKSFNFDTERWEPI